MLTILYLFTIVSFIFFKPKKRHWLFYAIILCLLLWTSKGTYTDFDGYYEIFETINISGQNLVGATPGWFWLCRLFGLVGLNYYGMTLVLTIVSFYLMHRLFLEFEANENVIWATLLIFPLLINGIQIRFFSSMAIVVYSLKFLLFDKKFALIKYCIGVLLATLVHSAAAIFIICFLVLIYERHSPKINVLITIIVCAAAISGVVLVPIVAKRFLLPSQYARYISNSITESSVKWVVAISVCWMITILLYRFVITARVRHQLTKIDYTVIYKRIYRIICLLGLTLPLLVFDRNYHRYIQLGYILDALCLGIYWRNIGRGAQKGTNSRWTVFTFFVIALIPAIYSFEFIPVNATAPLFSIEGFPSIFR